MFVHGNRLLHLALAGVFLLSPNGSSLSFAGVPEKKAGQVLDTKAVGPDTEPPKITLASPRGLKTVRTSQLWVSGSVTDAKSKVKSVDLHLNGNKHVLPLKGGRFSIHVKLAAGSNSLLISARDTAGNIGTTSYAIACEVEQPEANTASQSVASNPTEATTGNPESTDGEGRKSEAGITPNELGTTRPAELAAPDEVYLPSEQRAQEVPPPEVVSGNQVNQVGEALRSLAATTSFPAKQPSQVSTAGRQTLAVVGDSESPVVRLTSPGGPTVTRNGTYSIIGSVNDNISRIQSVILSVNGEPSSVPVLNGRFKGTATLREGSNTFVVTARDKAGNEGSTNVFVIRDSIAPSVILTSPAKPGVNEAQQLVVGTVSDNVSRVKTVAVKLNGRETMIPVLESGTFSQSVRLNKGKNLVEVRATDEAGNTRSTPFTLVLDTVKPTLTLQAPPNRLLTNQSPLTFSGKASDNQMAIEKIVLRVKDWTKEVPVYSGSFSDSVPLSEGDNPVVLTVSDDSGNTTSRTSSVTLDLVPPTIYIDTPINGSTVTAQTVQLTGRIQDNYRLGAATLALNGTSKALTVSSVGNFNVSIPLKAGENQIKVTAIDAAGNTGTSAPWTVSYQEAPAQIGNTALDGLVLEYGTEKPIAGATVTSSTGKTTTTNADGQYFLETMPGTQSVHIVDSRYTPADRLAECIAGQHVGVQTVYLTSRDTKSTPIDAETGGTVINSDGNAQLVVPPGALDTDQEISITIQKTVDDVSALPGPLPEGSYPLSFADLQPDGLSFNKFVTLRLPNWRHLPPGTPAPCAYWDTEKLVWAGVSGGVVSSDGKYLELPISHFTSYGFFRPAMTVPTPPRVSDPTRIGNNGVGRDPGRNGPTKDPRGCGWGSNVDVTTGNLSLDYKLKSLPSVGLATSPMLTYNSKNRTRSVSFKLRLGDDPQRRGWSHFRRIDWELTVAGRIYKGTGPLVDVNWDTRDARGLYVEPGVYPVTIRTTSMVDVVSYLGTTPGTVTGTQVITAFVRGPGSRYGLGWNLNYDQRLVINPASSSLSAGGYYWLTMPNGHIATFTKRAGSETIESEPGLYSRLTEVKTNDLVTGYLLTDRDGTRHDFNDRGWLVSTTDRNGNTRQIRYDGELITAIIDSSGQATRLEYDNQGKLQTVTDAFGRLYRFSINDKGLLESIADPLDHAVSYTYSDLDYLAKVTNERGHVVQYRTQQDGSLTDRIGPDGSHRRYEPAPNFIAAPTAGIMSKKVVADTSGRLWFTSARPTRSEATSDAAVGVMWFERSLSYLDTSTGETASYGMGEFAAQLDPGYMPLESEVTAKLGACVIDETTSTIYVGIPNEGLRAVKSSTGEVLERYSIPGFQVEELFFDKARKLVWSSYGGLVRYDVASKKVTKLFDDTGFIKGAAMDAAGNVWLFRSRSLQKISPDGVISNTGIWFGGADASSPIRYDASKDRLLFSIVTDGFCNINFVDCVTNNLSVSPYYGGIATDVMPITDGSIWVRDSYSRDWYFGMKTQDGIDVDYFSSHDRVPNRDMYYVGHENLEPILDKAGKFWLIGANYFYCVSNSISPTYSNFTDSNGNSTQFGLFADENGRLMTIDASGNIVRHQLNLEGERILEVDPNGEIVNTAYSTKGNVVTIYRWGKDYQVNNGWSIDRDPVNDLPIRIQAPDQTVTTAQYDERGNLLQLNEPEGRTSKYTYDANGTLSSETNSRGYVTRFDRNANGTISRVLLADGTSIGIEYDAFGNPKQVTDSQGRVIRYGFDALNRMTSVTYVMTDGKEETTNYSYEDGGDCGCLGSVDQVANIKDAMGRVTRFEYDPNHNLKAILRPDGTSEHWVYDGEKNLLSYTDANGKLTRYAYDADNRLISETDPLGRVTQFEYDMAGYRTAVIDPKGNRTTYTYGVFNRLESITDARGGKIELGYDKVDNLISIKDPLGKETTRTFDGLGRLKSECNSAYETTVYEYDAANNLVKKTDPKSQVTSFEYDVLDQLTRKVMADDTAEFSYDAVGNILSAKNKNGEERFTYDARGRLLSKLEVESGRTLRYSYDSLGNLATMIDAEGKGTRYAYDDLDRLKTLTFDPSGLNLVFGFEYDAKGQRTKLTRPNKVDTSYAYDDSGQLLSIVSKRTSDNQVLQNLSYVYDLNGNRIEKTDANGKVTYGYDAINQLIHENRPNHTTSWEYDLAGNRLTETGATSKSYDYTGQAPNRLVGISDGTAFTYDRSGNMLTESKDGVMSTLVYNAENQLEQIDRAGQVWNFRFDPFGRRIQKIDPPGMVTMLLNDADDLISEYDHKGSIVVRNIFAGLDEPLARVDSSVSYYLADALGSITSIVGENGVITDTYIYDVWGNSLTHTGRTIQPFGFTARESVGSGLFFYRARFYHSLSGRFTQIDPLGFGAGDTNLYKYVLNNPASLTDPFGLIPKWEKSPNDMWGGGIGAGGGTGIGSQLSRGGAFNSAKRDLGIPRTQQPEKVFKDDFKGEGIIGQPREFRVYQFKRPNGETVYIQDHWPGHMKGPEPPHMNVRPQQDGRYTGKGRVKGTKGHYYFDKNGPCPL